MYLVLIAKKPHSAWDTVKEASHQARILLEAGYKKITLRKDLTINCENGHYYV